MPTKCVVCRNYSELSIFIGRGFAAIALPRPAGYTLPMVDSVLHIMVKPKSPRNEVARVAQGVLVRVTAPPVEGAANAAVIEALAKALGVPKSRLAITGGATGKLKRVSVSGISPSELDEILAKIPSK